MKEEKIILAGGCFWGIEAYFKKIKGVFKTYVGYTGCEKENPTYEQVCNSSGHVEAVEIYFNNDIINLEKILFHFFRIIDPISINKQGEDKGIQYRTGIYFNTEKQEKIINNFIEKKQKSYTEKIVVEVKEQTPFYNAEDYHQSYLDKNPNGYCHIDLSLLND